MSINDRISALGIQIPISNQPVGAFTYLPFGKIGNLVYVSGQLPKKESVNGTVNIVKGKVGRDVSAAEATEAARQCGVCILSVVRDACDGDLDRVCAVVKVDGFVNSVDSFVDHPQVINGCSDLFVDVFGPAIGSHARAAVGCSSLPLGVPVEISAIFQLS